MQDWRLLPLAIVSTNRVALVTLGCARNDVDSDELASRLAADGWELVDDADDADAVIVNTCGFVEAAKKDSIDTVLEYADDDRPVVAVGCLAQRYGKELADALPEADAVLGFDQYPDISDRLRAVMAGETIESHTPGDRRKLLPISPVERVLHRLCLVMAHARDCTRGPSSHSRLPPVVTVGVPSARFRRLEGRLFRDAPRT